MSNIAYLLSEVLTLKKMIRDSHPGRVLERQSLEGRLLKVQDEFVRTVNEKADRQ
jgi:hypothetical protein